MSKPFAIHRHHLVCGEREVSVEYVDEQTFRKHLESELRGTLEPERLKSYIDKAVDHALMQERIKKNRMNAMAGI